MDNKKIVTSEVMPTVPITRLRTIADKTKNLPKDTNLTLEFILTGLFPSVWNNIQIYAKDCYTSGYIQGLKDGKNESKGNN